MVNFVPEWVTRVWESWNIRGALIFSLLLQTILVLFAPSRKRTSRTIVILMVWLGYLLADAVAEFAVGLITNSLRCNSSPSARENSDLLAFWAPFLLLHLGGPDTITAFSLEDNALWLRHALALILRAAATLYVFIQTLKNNKVMTPTILLFVVGIIKYLERTLSLYFASIDKFRDSMLSEPDPGPNYAKLMDEYVKKKDEHSTQIIYMPEPEKDMKVPTMNEEPLEELVVVQKAYEWFNVFKGLIVDRIFSFKERNDSLDFFYYLGPVDALRVVEVELNFIYEVLFTKAVVVHSNWGRFFRLTAFCAVVSALVVFRFHVKKQGYYNMFDVRVTYALLLGAMALDIISLFMAIFSDWTVTSLEKSDSRQDSSCWESFKTFLATTFEQFLKFKTRCQFDYFTEKPVKHTVIYTPFVFRRWSHHVSTHNLITYCLKGRPNGIYKYRHQNLLTVVLDTTKINLIVDPIAKFITKLVQFLFTCIAFLLWPIKMVVQFLSVDQFLSKSTEKLIDKVGLKDFVDEMLYLGTEPLTRELWEFIFGELREKSKRAKDSETTKRIFSARGDLAVQKAKLAEDTNRNLMSYILDVSYDESLLLWHVATELLYEGEQTETNTNPIPGGNYQIFSKLLSAYMLYLLIFQPTMMAAAAGIGKIRFRDTCAETYRFIEENSLKWPGEEETCEKILDVRTEIKPIDVKGDRSKSVLFDACELAKQLRELGKEEKWDLISGVWVELLSYAAGHCRATGHAQQVSKGGELVSLVWLTMAHFGIGNQFQINEGHAQAKLIVGQKNKKEEGHA